MSAGDEALRNATGLSMDGLMSWCQDSNRTFEIRASPWMARCRDGKELPHAESPEVLRFSCINKRIAMERVRTG